MHKNYTHEQFMYFCLQIKYYIINHLGTYKESRNIYFYLTEFYTLKFEKSFTNYLKILAVLVVSWRWASWVFPVLHLNSNFKIAGSATICDEGKILFFPNPLQMILFKMNQWNYYF